MSDHDHIEGLIGRIHRVGARRSCRSGKDICLPAHLDDVRGMPATGPFGVKGVDGSALEGCDSGFDKTALVQRVGVDGNLHIHVIGDREAAIDGGGSRTPVFMKLQAARPGLDLFNETRWRARIAFAQDAEIHGKGIGGLEHPPYMPGPWRAGRGSRPRCRPCSAAHHGREA